MKKKEGKALNKLIGVKERAKQWEQHINSSTSKVKKEHAPAKRVVLPSSKVIGTAPKAGDDIVVLKKTIPKRHDPVLPRPRKLSTSTVSVSADLHTK